MLSNRTGNNPSNLVATEPRTYHCTLLHSTRRANYGPAGADQQAGALSL